jgi:hypothetical protein
LLGTDHIPAELKQQARKKNIMFWNPQPS